MFRPVHEQLEILLRGCLFADEVEGAAPATGSLAIEASALR